MTVYTPDEAAEILKVTRQTVYNLIKRGDLPCVKVGSLIRVSADQLEKYLQTARLENTLQRIARRNNGIRANSPQ